MLRVESGADLLLAKEHSAPFKMTDFSVFGVGGGFIVVNHYGDYNISVARIDFGVMGEAWKDMDEAIHYLHRTAGVTSSKCSATDLKIGGAGVVLYFKSPDIDSPETRRVLYSELSKQLQEFYQTNVLCLPGNGMVMHDLSELHAQNELVLKECTTTSAGEEKKLPDGVRSRSGSFAKAQEEFEFPVPSALLGKDVIASKTLEKSAAYSAYGSIVTLLKAKEWVQNSFVLLGVTPASCELYWLLSKESDTVFMSDPDSSKYEELNIPPRAFLPWNKAFSADNNWDILVFCSRHCPTLDEATVESLGGSRAVIALSDDFRPDEWEERERSSLAFEKNGMFDFSDGLSDLGEIAMLYTLSQRTGSNKFTDKNAFDMGAKVMSSKVHLHEILESDEHDEKKLFYSLMLNENINDIGGRQLGLGTIMHSSSDRMTDWMWSKAKNMCPFFRALSSQNLKTRSKQVNYLDLGAGNGAAARWICKQDSRIHFLCVDANPKQNSENRTRSDDEGLGGQIDIQLGSFENLPVDYSNAFDGCMSQDSFIHAFNRVTAFCEAYRVTKGGGWLMISDLMRGEGHNDEELQNIVGENTVTHWVTPTECVELAKEAGWVEVHFYDCSTEIKMSLQGLLTKVKSMISSGSHEGRNLKLLQKHRLGLSSRIGQIDRGVFKWGIIAGRKPYDVVFLSTPPVTPEPNPMMNYTVNEMDGILKFGTDVIVVNIKERLTHEAIMELPSTTRLIVTMSAGLDHICVEAADARGIRIRRAARMQIVKSVADYLLSNVIFGLRNGFQNVGVPFPGKDWNLQWNADGVDLDDSKIGFIGMGAIAIETARRIRALSNSCKLVYHVPDSIRCRFEEGTYHMYHVGIADLLSTCDVIIPMVPLTSETMGLINYTSFAMMKRTGLFMNMARGKVVETPALLRALKEKLIRHAILDTTDPEPLPKGHELWDLQNCTITPHFATNTTYVRKELVEDIPNQVADTLDERGILRLEEQRARQELSEAYRITREFGMDELVWNHISVLLSDGTFLIGPGSRMFDDIGPQDLVKSSGNITADIIHEAIYKHRSDVRAIVHLHTPATVAVSCLEMGFVPLAQEAAPFYKRVARHKWHGVSNDREEQALLGESCKDPKVNTLLMENHGFCTFGSTLGEAWVLAYYFDKACRTQLTCLQTGQKINYPSEDVLEKAGEQSLLPEFLPGNCEWEALRKMLTRRQRHR